VVIEGDPAIIVKQTFDAHQARTRPERVRRITAWDRWWVMGAILLVWGVAWGLRRSGGLI
jgi:hypothetical protein